MKSPEFYRERHTWTIGIVCPDCPAPENLVHSICILGMDLIQTLDVGRIQWIAWTDHRRQIHGEDADGNRIQDWHLGATGS